ncbi:hypothetical protein H1235_08580 [Pseudoxanthomonas sp. NC8]|nr:hypothetical protein H1235_08580 [Pseudoxanthomonas sp. NC8]
MVDALDTPAAAGWWRPVVLLPAALLSRLPAEYIEALLAHELAHVRRHDYLGQPAAGPGRSIAVLPPGDVVALASHPRRARTRGRPRRRRCHRRTAPAGPGAGRAGRGAGRAAAPSATRTGRTRRPTSIWRTAHVAHRTPRPTRPRPQQRQAGLPAARPGRGRPAWPSMRTPSANRRSRRHPHVPRSLPRFRRPLPCSLRWRHRWRHRSPVPRQRHRWHPPRARHRIGRRRRHRPRRRHLPHLPHLPRRRRLPHWSHRPHRRRRPRPRPGGRAPARQRRQRAVCTGTQGRQRLPDVRLQRRHAAGRGRAPRARQRLPLVPPQRLRPMSSPIRRPWPACAGRGRRRTRSASG